MMTQFIYLAPLKGLTDHIFRNVFFRHFHGIDATIAPFITSVAAERINRKLIKDILPENNKRVPVIPQILSKSADDFIILARAIHDLGYDEVNWNLGCPFPQVAKKHRGSGLLPYPQRVETILGKVIPAIPTRLSVKTRLGRFKADELRSLIPIFNTFPLSEVIIHPRTGSQMYGGAPDLLSFKYALENLEHPVVYNGDIVDEDSFWSLKAQFKNVSRWMIGRGLLANPFLAEKIKNLKKVKRGNRERFYGFYTELFNAYEIYLNGPGHLMDRMKAFWVYFGQLLSDDEKLVKNILRSGNLNNYRLQVDRLFEVAQLSS